MSRYFTILSHYFSLESYFVAWCRDTDLHRHASQKEKMSRLKPPCPLEVGLSGEEEGAPCITSSSSSSRNNLGPNRLVSAPKRGPTYFVESSLIAQAFLFIHEKNLTNDW